MKQKSKIAADVVEIIDDYDIVINKGVQDGISENQKYLIYCLGEEIMNPDTGKSLGNLEIVCGKAKIKTIKDNECTLTTDLIIEAVPYKNYGEIKKDELDNDLPQSWKEVLKSEMRQISKFWERERMGIGANLKQYISLQSEPFNISDKCKAIRIL